MSAPSSTSGDASPPMVSTEPASTPQSTTSTAASIATPPSPTETPTPTPTPTEPRRAPGVPASARWFSAENEWQLQSFDDDGRIDGGFRSWRADGTLRTVATIRHGRQIGAAWRFHPDGNLQALGQFVDGVPRGPHRRYASAGPAGEPLQSCCVPPGAWQLREDFGPQGVSFRGWFNHEGDRLLESGELYPARPPSVPPRAEIDETTRMWDLGGAWTPTGRSGTRRRWSLDGVLRLVEELDRGERHGTVQSFYASGDLAWEAHYERNHLDGAFRSFGLGGGHFEDPDVRGEEGAFTADQACGVWRYLDGGGVLRAERDLGPPIDPDRLLASPAFGRDRQPAESWLRIATTLSAEGRLGEALLAAARAAAERGDADPLKRALAVHTVPLGAEVARAEANATVARAPDNLVPLVDGMKRGRDPAILLCAIAKALPGAPRTAHDLVSAALLLAPDAPEALATRVLLRASLGAVAGARDDVARLAPASPEQAALLDLMLRAYFPRFEFWPARADLDDRADAAGPQLERELADVRDAIARYATRLMRLRATLRAHVPDDVPFMIPDLSALLPDGPVPLRAWAFTMSAQEYAGGVDATDGDSDGDGDSATDDESGDRSDGDGDGDRDRDGDGDRDREFIEILVDESVGLAPTSGADGGVLDLLPIMRQARADWSGLTWLCWAVGLGAPGLPNALAAPAGFGSAAVMTMERAWRCHDKLRTSGLFALAKGIPGFLWEGTEIELMPSTLADVALAEYIEARAVFSWLCDPANRSPWQTDLRVAG